MPETVWHVTIPAIALMPAATADDAERIVAEALDRAGFCPYEEGRRVFESEPVEPAVLFRSADNPDSVKSNASDATKAAFLLAADAMNRFGLLAHADPGVKPELAAKINNWRQDLSSCDWPILGYDTSDPPATGSVKTWTYSQVNPGGADVTHGLTFTGTDDEWAEHLAGLTYQGIEPYNAKTDIAVPGGHSNREGMI
jgi:hypothetical protein